MTPRFKSPQVNEEVLARWTDGLFYKAVVTQIHKPSGKCLLRFHTDSCFWVFIKDLQQGQESCNRWHRSAEKTTKACLVCHSPSNEINKQLLTCSQCHTAIHQHCHKPAIHHADQLLIDWRCSQCQAKPITSHQNGFKASINPSKKLTTTLPYKISALTWDSQHKVNAQKRYCYCGKNGKWYLKMLQCFRCKMWYHQDCLHNPNKPSLLYGDRFYLLVCSVCSKQEEFLQRLKLTWVDVTQLALFNLTVHHRRKYFSVSRVITAWVLRHWQNLQITSHLLVSPQEELEKMITNVLINNPKKFQCGKEIKKDGNLWGLRVNVAPQPPKMVWSINSAKTQLALRQRKLIGETKKFLKEGERDCNFNFRKRKRVESPPEQNGRRRVESPSEQNGRRRVAAKMMKRKNGFVGGRMLRMKNGKITNKRLTQALQTDSQFDTGSVSSLETIIPCLPDYEADNHPFRTQLECTTALEQKRRKERVMLLFGQHSGTSTPVLSRQTASETDSDPWSSLEGVTDVKPNTKALVQAVNRIKHKPGRKTQKELLLLEAASKIADEQGVDLESLATVGQSGGASRSANLLEKSALDGLSQRRIPEDQLRSTVGNYFGAAQRLNSGERFHVQGRRVTQDGRVQYLIQWENCNPIDLT